TDREQMEQVLAIYAQRAATRLHRNNSEAKVVTAWAMTSHFNEEQSHQPSATVALPAYSADPVVLIKAAKNLLPKITEGVRYAKAGITVTQLRPVGAQSMFDEFVSSHESKNVGELLEQVRTEHGGEPLDWAVRDCGLARPGRCDASSCRRAT